MFGSFLPSSNLKTKQTKKNRQSLIPSNKTFWIRAYCSPYSIYFKSNQNSIFPNKKKKNKQKKQKKKNEKQKTTTKTTTTTVNLENYQNVKLFGSRTKRRACHGSKIVCKGSQQTTLAENSQQQFVGKEFDSSSKLPGSDHSALQSLMLVYMAC